MKGLLTKDLRIILLQKNTFFIMIIASLCMINVSLHTMVMCVCYMLCGLAIGTLSYDDFDNGMPYILCLPITKKKYIDEKFLLVFFTTLLGFILAQMIGYIYLFINNNFNIEFFIESLVLLPLIYLIITIQIPIRLKFGQEKSRIINIFSMIIIVVTGTLIIEAFAKIEVLARSIEIIYFILLLIAIFIIYKISIKLISSKQF